MAAPSFIQEAETAWNSATSPKTTASFDVVAGDVLAAFYIQENYNPGQASWIGSISGGSLTWNVSATVAVADYTWVRIWTATVDSNKSMTVTFTLGGGGFFFGGNVLTFRGSDGVGAANQANASSNDSQLDLTTTQNNSAIVIALGDWNATDGASRTYLTTDCGTFTEQSYFRNTTNYAIYGGYYADAGTAAAGETVGVNTPNSMKWALCAVEIKGTAAAAATSLPPFPNPFRHLLVR